MRRKVSCSRRPARAFRPSALSAMRSKAHWSYRCSAFSPLRGTPAAVAASMTCCSSPADRETCSHSHQPHMPAPARDTYWQHCSDMLSTDSTGQASSYTALCACTPSMASKPPNMLTCQQAAPPRMGQVPLLQVCHVLRGRSPSGEQRPSGGCSQSRISTQVKLSRALCFLRTAMRSA